MSKCWLIFAGIFGALGVCLGAFGAHGLKNMLSPEDLTIYETGVRYQMYHSFALMGYGFLNSLAEQKGHRLAKWPGVILTSGIVIFSGSLYLLVLTGTRQLGAITPIGGLCFIAGWIGFALQAWRLPVSADRQV